MKTFSCSLLIIVHIISIQLYFIGCSNTVPSLTNVEPCVIYEYNTIQDIPSQKLSVFVQSSPDTARVSDIKIIFPDEQFQWQIIKPMILNNGSQVWTGSANLMPPYFSTIPRGKYTVSYTNLAGEQATSNFTLEYKEITDLPLNQPVFETKSENETSQETSKSEPIKKIAIYSEANGLGTLLYYDKVNHDWQNFDDIVKTYEDAKSLRICLDYPSSQVRYLLPFHNFN